MITKNKILIWLDKHLPEMDERTFKLAMSILLVGELLIVIAIYGGI